MRYKLIIAFVIIFGSFPFFSSATEINGLTIVPSIIDDTASPRDILEYEVALENNTESLKEVYAFVNDMSKDGGLEPDRDVSLLDRSSSLARWIKVTRSAQKIWPGEKKTIPIEVDVNQNAKPGKYFAVITFSEGGNTTIARNNMDGKNQPQVFLNIEVKENIIEKAQIQKFRTPRSIFVKNPVNFEVEINNFGNREIIPEGSIFIYNRKGEEAGVLAVNEEREIMGKESGKVFSNEWNPDKAFGRYRARLELKYGGTERDLQDTIYFWFLPFNFLIIFFSATFLFIVILTVIIFKKSYKHHHYSAASVSPARKTEAKKTEPRPGVLDLKNPD